MHYLLFYEVAHDFVSRRAEFREIHLQKAREASERGELVLAGALANPVDGAVLLFKGDSPEVAENFARADPYVISGAVKRWYVREWTTVVGEEAAMPVKSTGSPSLPAMILRMWKGRTSAEQAEQYIHHVTKRVFPSLGSIKGHRGAYLLRRTMNDAIEFVVLTLWESMDAVRKFAGSDADKAVVELEARAVLTDFDEHVVHFEVIHSSK
jgi:heme-degrading monooxygenase HmoA/uncharacterized protein YciI